MRIKVRGDRVYPVRDAAMRDDVRSRRVSRVKPYRDQARVSEPGYVHSLPAVDGKRYTIKDGEEPENLLHTFLGTEEDPESEGEVQPTLPEGDYYGMNSFDGGMHIYRRPSDEGEALPVPENAGSRIGNDLPPRLAAQNRDNAAFWRKQYAGDAPHSAPPNVRAIASAIAAARSDGGTHDAAMLMQKANHAMNLANRAFYAGGGRGTHDVGGPPKGPPTAASINAKNRARWGAGRQ